MTDVRESILGALVTVCEGIDGVVTVERNKLQVSDISRPAIIVLDGGERTEMGFGGGKPSVAPLVVSMSPSVTVFVGGVPEAVSPAVAAFRAAIISAVLSDSSLLALCKDGDIRYEGCATGFTAGQRIEADLSLDFTIRYVLRPNDL
jgi:hypothetical protein